MTVAVRIVDIMHGCPAGGVEVHLERRSGTAWVPVRTAATDEQGEVAPERWGETGEGTLRVIVDSRRFYASLGIAGAQSEVSTTILVTGRDEYHLSILMAPFACTLHTARRAS